MRILQVGPIPPEIGGKTGGGVATHLWSLAAYLDKQGHTVGVLGGNYYVKAAEPEIKEGIHLYGLMGLSRSFRTSYALCPSFWLKLLRTKIHYRSLMGWKVILSSLLNYRRIIQAFKPDIIHVHHLEYRFPFVYFLVKDRVPILTTVHSTSFIEFSSPLITKERKQFIKRNLSLARNLIFVSHFLKSRFEALFPGSLGNKNTCILHNPVDDAVYYPISREVAREKLGLRPNGSVILFVGNLIPQKNLPMLIEALKLLHDRGTLFKLFVIGDGSQRAELVELVARNELSEKIHFEGLKSQEELFLYYNAADLFVLPSAMESFGLVFVEAMLCGCPVLGGAEALQEILPSERCGVRLGSSDPGVWADSMAQAIEGSWSREEIHNLSQVYTWEVLGDEFDRIYNQMVN